MRVIFLSNAPFDSVFRVGSHHYASVLAGRGAEVTYWSTAVTPAHVAKASSPPMRRRLRQAVGPLRWTRGIAHGVALAPTPLESGLDEQMDRWSAHACAKLMRRRMEAVGRGAFDLALVDQPTFARVVAALGPRTVVYRPTDTYERNRMRAAEARLLRSADAIAATSRVVLQELPVVSGDLPSCVLENGVEFARFSAASGDGAPRNGAVYVGALDERFDWDTVIEWATRMPSQPFTLVGPVRQSPPPLPANIRLTGAMDYDEVPRVLGQARVGILPLSEAPANQGRSPMKFYEYLASGLYVVARRTTSLEARRARGVALFDEAAEGVGALAAFFERDVANHEGQDDARAFDWTERTDRLLELVDRSAAGSPRG